MPATCGWTPSAAETAIASLASSLGLDPMETAEGIVRVANQEMVRALRVVTVERGIDPRRFALLPFGGAGPMHAAEIAAELEIDRILCPRAGGVLSALGLCASDRRRDTTRTVMLAGEDFSAERVARAVEELAADLGGDDPDATPEVTYEMRYAGQAFELPVSGSTRPDPADLAERFAAAHEQLYGHRDPEAEVVLVHIRLAMVTPGARPRPDRGRRNASSAARGGSASTASGWRRRSCAASRARGRKRRARSSSSCPRRPSSCPRTGAPRSTQPAPSAPSSRCNALRAPHGRKTLHPNQGSGPWTR